MSFSKKFNLEKVILLQIDSMTLELRNALWNPVCMALWDFEHSTFRDISLITSHIWVDLLEWHIEDLLSLSPVDAKEKIKDKFLHRASWNEIYDFIACIAEFYSKSPKMLPGFASLVNGILEKHNSAYRLNDAEFIRVTEPILLEAIEEMKNNPKIAHSIKAELNKAIIKLSEHGETKNLYAYNEAVEAAIHMLEAYFREKTGESTLSKALRKDKTIKGIFFTILDKLYAFSNEHFRHAAKSNQVILEYSDALYILHLALALINYLEYPGQLFQLADQLEEQ